MAGMYAVWHGPAGIRRIANRVNRYTAILRAELVKLGVKVANDNFFDTLLLETGAATPAILTAADCAHVNLRRVDGARLAVSLDETVTAADLQALVNVFASGLERDDVELDIDALDAAAASGIPAAVARESAILKHPVFSSVQSETDMLRYLRKLADKDLALDRTMIPLGSCTMKLNATAEMIPITWPEFALIHPFAPASQSQGYKELIDRLSAALCEITGYDNISLQPNSGAQGEYAGLLAIRGYHQANGQHQRNVCLILVGARHQPRLGPAGRHGCGGGGLRRQRQRRPARPARQDRTGRRQAGRADDHLPVHAWRVRGSRDRDLRTGAPGRRPGLPGRRQHERHGGRGPARQVRFRRLAPEPAQDLLHPARRRRPGVGPVAVRAHLAPYLPGVVNEQGKLPGEAKVGPVSAAPFGSAGILPIPFVYISLMGADGLRRATEVAILNANYVATRLRDHYPVLYAGRNGRVAHECILDVRPLKETSGISAEDIAKRLMDYGFHAPTMSFPVAGTLMVEPTESESQAELDRFVDAMISIREEIAQVERGERDREDNVLKNAPHTAQMLLAEEWLRLPAPAGRLPVASLRDGKYWPPVARVDNAYGDRNLVCACLPVEAYA